MQAAQHGGTALPGEIADQGENVDARPRIEARHRLVGEQEPRFEHQRPRHPDALLLPAREGGDAAEEGVLGKADLAGELPGALAQRRRIPPGEAAPQADRRQAAGEDVACRGQPLDQPETLVDHRHLAADGSQAAVIHPQAVEPHLAFAWRLQAVDHAEQGGFARARRAEQHHELAPLDRQRDVAQRARAVRPNLANAAEGEHRFGHRGGSAHDRSAARAISAWRTRSSTRAIVSSAGRIAASDTLLS